MKFNTYLSLLILLLLLAGAAIGATIQTPSDQPTIPGVREPGDVLIDELFYDPSGADGGYEYILLYNAAGAEIDLTGWEIQWGGTDFTYGTYSIPTAVLGAGEDLLIGGVLMSPVPDIINNFNFQNSGFATDGVRITDGGGVVIDSVLYGSPNRSALPGDGGLDPYPDEMCAADVPSGKVLTRDELHTDTDDCALDFTEADPVGDCVDADGDGFKDEVCGGADCDDTDPSINPGLYEGISDDNCSDGKDNDCDGLADTDAECILSCCIFHSWPVGGNCVSSPPCSIYEEGSCCKEWSDIYGFYAGCFPADYDNDGFIGGQCDGDDCDDEDPAVHPGAEEICENTIDDDCDGFADTYDTDCGECDDDSDGYDDEACGGADCDDTDPDIYPGADEICDNGIDDDCDGLVDGLDPDCCDDADGDGVTDETCGGYDCDDSDPAIYPGADDPCDGMDQACDGLGEEVDSDIDSSMICEGDCDDTDSDTYPGAPDPCDGIDQDCDGDDGLPEICNNGIDDDCDGLVDWLDTDCCRDKDGDGYGDPASPSCTFPQWDCDDAKPDVNPGADEICDNGIDDDCDGLIDYPDDPDCGFTLELLADYVSGDLRLYFTLGTLEPATWANCLILTYPTFQVIPLWSVPLPVIDPPIELPISFPLPSGLGTVVIWTGLFTSGGTQAVEMAWVDTEDTIQIQSNLPETGVDLCYDGSAEIACPDPGEPFYGQDAQYVSNPMSFTDHGDGTVTDNITGLMWQQEDDDISKTWYEANDYCEALTLAGHTDWRLPDEYELQAIVDYGRWNPAIDTTYFPGTNPIYYWSSSPYASYDGDAWGVFFDFGYVFHFNKFSHLYVRCVRGEESPEQSFTDHGDGTVTDNMTGLMWQQEDDDVARNWESALAYCEELDLAGYADWRLPDAKELISIVDNTTYNPAIDTTYFHGTDVAYYWASSTNPACIFFAWSVFFYYGFVDYVNKNYHLYVVCVR